MAKLLKDLPLNALVKDVTSTYYGVPVIFRIADKNHPGYPSNSVTLVTDKIVSIKCFDAKEPNNSDSNRRQYGNNRYKYSNIHHWLNSEAGAGAWYSAQHPQDAPPNSSNVWDSKNPYQSEVGFLNGFSADFKKAILDTTLKVARNTVTDGGGYENVVAKMFLASTTEVGLENENGIAEGAKLAIFSNNNSRLAKPSKEATNHSVYPVSELSNFNWWLRSPYTASDSYNACYANIDGSLFNNAAYLGIRGVRPFSNLKSATYVSDTPDSDGVYKILWGRPPVTPENITVPDTVHGGQTTEISWSASSDPDGNLAGYILEKKENQKEWVQVYKGTKLNADVPVTFGIQTVQFRVKAYDDLGIDSDYKISEVKNVVNNHPPVIDGEDKDLGTLSDIFPEQQYTVTDEDGDTVTVTESLDGTELKSYTAVLGQVNTLTLPWVEVLNGKHSLTIKAVDTKGAETLRTFTFTKAVTSIEFEQTIALEADAMPTKAVVNIQGIFPVGSLLNVWICNNGNDSVPTWEEITQKVLSGKKIYFTNKEKTASNWGVKVKVSLKRGSANETCYIQSIGGNFA